MQRDQTRATLAVRRAGSTEGDLVHRAKGFEREAWDEIYETYYKKMYNFLYLHTGDRMAAEDLAAEVFEQACKGIRRFEYRGIPISSWLYRIAHNLMVDYLKRRGRYRMHSIETDGAPVLFDQDATDSVARQDEIARALCKLTDEQQRVLLLRHIEGHSVASAAEIMGKRENAIRALEFRALHSLRRIMNKDGSRKAGSRG